MTGASGDRGCFGSEPQQMAWCRPDSLLQISAITLASSAIFQSIISFFGAIECLDWSSSIADGQ